MSTLLIYAIKSAILLTLLLLPGILLLFREKMFRFNRATLLSIMVMSLVLPLCNFSYLSMDDVPAVQTIEIGLLQAGFPVEVADYEIEAEQTHFPWFYVVSILYAIGVTVVLSIRMREIFSMGRIIRRGSIWQKQEEDGIRIFCHADNVAPFSWLRSIVIGEKDYQNYGREIILHEKAHILHYHSLDILLLTFVEALQWWNPFVYLLGMYLRDVHEYQADDYVLRHGVSCHAYSELIIRKAVGASSYTFANSFNHSLTKKRITMMLNSNPSPWRRSRVLYVIPVAALALSAFATPEFKNASDLIEETVQTQDKITESSANKQAEGEKNVAQTDTLLQGLVGRIPGLETADDGTVYLNGKKVRKLLVNDKELTNDEAESKDEKTADASAINLYITAKGEMMMGSSAGAAERINPAEAMKVIAQNQDMTLNIIAEKGLDISTLAGFKALGRSNGKLKINYREEVFDFVDEGEEIYSRPEVNAQFPGGDAALMEWVQQNMQHPEDVKAQGGRVIINMVVEEDGSITNVRAIRSPHKSFSDEAIRLVKAMPRWKPAQEGGKPVRSYFNIPVFFKRPS